jgi:hypothetical protein
VGENATDEKRPACHEAMPWYRLVGSRDLLEPLALPSSWPVPQIKRTADGHAPSETWQKCRRAQGTLYNLLYMMSDATVLRNKTSIIKSQTTIGSRSG